MDFEIKPPTSYSAAADAFQYKYHHYHGKHGSEYLVKDGPYAADNIYCKGRPGSDGFGGATLTFKLVDGTTLEWAGPWHTNSQDLFGNTGIDIRDKHSTFVVIGEDVEIGGCKGNFRHPDIIKNVLYQDNGWQESEFDRGDRLAQKMANERGERVYLYTASHGGSHMCYVYPEKNNG